MIHIKPNQPDDALERAGDRLTLALAAARGAIIVAIVVAVGALVGCDAIPTVVEAPGEESDSGSSAQSDDPDASSGGERELEVIGAMPMSAESVVPEGDVTPVRLRFAGPTGMGELSVTIGAPGMWPPRELQTTQDTTLVLPVVRAEPYGDRTLTTYEVRAAGVVGDEAYAYWGDVDFGDDATRREVELKSAGAVAVRVTNEAGEPVSGASVRLSRGLVGLLNLGAETSDQGRVQFEGIPTGDYRLSVEADGYVRSVRHVLKTGSRQQDLDVELERGATVRGYVRDSEGRPVAGADVAIYPESPFADTEVDTGFLADLGVWSQVATTDLDGHYVARGIGADAVRVGVTAPDYAPALSELVRFGDSDAATVDLTLEEGRGLRARVVDEFGDPVAGATVRWESLQQYGGRSSSTNPSGIATFYSVPENAFVRAELGAWVSKRRNVSRSDEATGADVELVLRKPVVEDAIGVRLAAPPGVFVDSAALEMDDGQVCPPEQVDEDTWRFLDCEPGPGRLLVNTKARGSHTFAQVFDETNELSLPELARIKVILEGLAGDAWKDASIGWRWAGTEWRAGQFADERTPRQRVWTRQLLPGQYDVLFDHPATGEQRLTVGLDADGTTKTWTLKRRASLPIYVTDAQGAPVEDALIQVWSQGRLLREGYSRGANPLPIRLTPPLDIRVMAIDARRGEGMRQVSIAPDGDVEGVVVALEDALFTHDLPPRRVTDIDTIGDILGVPLVADGDSWLLDATNPESPAIKAGLERGDRLMWVREIDAGYSVAVERGRDVVEVTVK